MLDSTGKIFWFFAYFCLIISAWYPDTWVFRYFSGTLHLIHGACLSSPGIWSVWRCRRCRCPSMMGGGNIGGQLLPLYWNAVARIRLDYLTNYTFPCARLFLYLSTWLILTNYTYPTYLPICQTVGTLQGADNRGSWHPKPIQVNVNVIINEL